MPTTAPTIRLKDVAKRAGVAVSTVSMALQDHPSISDDTKVRIQRLSREIGYKMPERRARSAGGVKRLGFVVLGAPPNDEGYTSLAFELAAAAQTAGSRFEISTIHEIADTDGVFEQLKVASQEVDVLLLTGRLPMAVAQRLVTEGIRFLIIGDLLGGVETLALRQHVTTVGFDDTEMGRLAVGHLLAAGHRRIGFACETVYPGLTHDRFRNGYRLAHLEHGVALDPALEYVAGRRDADPAAAGCYYRQLAAPPTAYVLPNARMAAGLLADLKAHGAAPAPTAWMIGDSSDRAARYGLAQYPLVRGDARALAEQVILSVSDLVAGRGPMAITVPFSLANLEAEA